MSSNKYKEHITAISQQKISKEDVLFLTKILKQTKIPQKIIKMLLSSEDAGIMKKIYTEDLDQILVEL